MNNTLKRLKAFGFISLFALSFGGCISLEGCPGNSGSPETPKKKDNKDKDKKKPDNTGEAILITNPEE